MQSPIKYVKGDLFSVSEGVLAHACNCHGVWGGGIALEFKRRFPKAYEKYVEHCASHSPKQLLGTCALIPEGPYQIACLFTNDGNTQAEIVHYTQLAISDLVTKLPPKTQIHMPQINAGIFNVPWTITEAALQHTNAPLAVYIL